MRITRRELAGAAALAAGLAAAPAHAARSDAAIVGELLELERRSAALWANVDAELAPTVREQEEEHARGLEQALEGMGRRAPSGDAEAPPGPGLEAALRFEERLVEAYSRAVGEVRNRRLLLPLAAIAANHGQHLVIARRALGRRPLTRAFEPVE